MSPNVIASRRPRVILVEPDINPITRRFGLPIIAQYPPLAQVRLAGQIDGADVEIVDLRIPGERRGLLERVRGTPPDLVGISLTFTSNGDEAIDIAGAIRRLAPGTAIVLGGSAPSEDPQAFLGSAADLICFRQGDAPLAGLIREIGRSGRAPDRFPGFFHREGERWRLTKGEPQREMADLSRYAWHLLPRRYWRYYFQGFRPTGIGQTSEGCPFDCTFCSVWKTHGRKTALASLENVQHDFQSLPRIARGFFFADDIWLQASEQQIRGLYDLLLEWIAADFMPRRPGFWITVETRTDLYMRQEERFKDWIRRGGLKWIFFGVEAVTDGQLKAFSKRNTVDTNSEAIRRASEAGAFVTAQFVIPCDAERSYFDEIVRFLKAHRPWIRTSNFTIATPLPGTDLYHEALAESPDLADRTVVTHPAFSLFTALSPTRLDLREFYEQVARVYKAANHGTLRPEVVRQGLLMLRHSPWLAPRLTAIPSMLRALTDPGTFLDVHRQVQGDRLMTGRPLPTGYAGVA